MPMDASMRPCVYLACLCVAACSGTPTRTAPRPLDAPVRSMSRMYEMFLSPAAIGRDVGEMRDRTRSLLANETDVRAPLDSAGNLLRTETNRLGDAPRSAGRLLGAESERLGDLRTSPGYQALDPRQDLADLGQSVRALPHTLQLDRRPMGESDDRRHRTDPDDDRPEASFGARLWRRLFP